MRGTKVKSPVRTRIVAMIRTGMMLCFWMVFMLGAAHAASMAGAGGSDQVSPFMYELALFVLAIFVGYFVVWAVTPALHTPLMAVTNAISSVIIVGALLAVGADVVSDAGAGLFSGGSAAKFFGFLALVMAAVNIFGGFLVTQRMLGMYKKKER